MSLAPLRRGGLGLSNTKNVDASSCALGTPVMQSGLTAGVISLTWTSGSSMVSNTDPTACLAANAAGIIVWTACTSASNQKWLAISSSLPPGSFQPNSFGSNIIQNVGNPANCLALSTSVSCSYLGASYRPLVAAPCASTPLTVAFSVDGTMMFPSMPSSANIPYSTLQSW